MTVVRIPVDDDEAGAAATTGATAATTTSSAHDLLVRTDADAVMREPPPTHEQQQQRQQQQQQHKEQQQEQEQEEPQQQQQEAILSPVVVTVSTSSSNTNNDTNTTTTTTTPRLLVPPTPATSFPSSSSTNGVSIGAAANATVTTTATATKENEITTTTYTNTTSCSIRNMGTPQNTNSPSTAVSTATVNTTNATHLNTQQQQPPTTTTTTTTTTTPMSLTDFITFVNHARTTHPMLQHLVRAHVPHYSTIPMEQLRTNLIAHATKFPASIPTVAAVVAAGKKKRLCKFPGCTRVIKSQGHCQRHGAKAKRCKVDGCDKQAQGTHQGMCKRHWREWTGPGQQEARAPSAGTVATTAAVRARLQVGTKAVCDGAGEDCAATAAAAVAGSVTSGPPAREVEPVVPPPPPAEGVSVYATILPASIAYRPNNNNSASTSSGVPPAPQTSQPHTENWESWESFREGGPGGVVSVQLQEKPATAAVPVPTTAALKTTKKKVVVESPAMPLVTFLADGARTQPCGWHRHGERRARGLYPVTSSSAVVQPFEAWETQLALVEILLLGGGTPSANFQDLAYAWGREPGFHRSVVSKLCHRRGEISQRHHHKPPSRRSSSHHKTGLANNTTTQPNVNHNNPTITPPMTTTNSDNTTYTNLKTVEAKKVAEEQWHATNGITKKQKLSHNLPNQQLQEEDIERRRRQPDPQSQPQHPAQQSLLLVHDTVETTNQGGSVLPTGNYPQHSAVETKFTSTPPAAGGTPQQQQQLPPPVYPMEHDAVETPVVSTPPRFPATPHPTPYTHALQQPQQQTQNLLQQQLAMAGMASANHSMNVGPYSDLLHGRRNSNTTNATLLASSQTQDPTALLYTAPPQYSNSHPQKLPTLDCLKSVKALVPGDATAKVPMPLQLASAGVSPVLLEVFPADLMTLSGGINATILPWTEQEDSIVIEAVTLSSEQPFTRWSDLAVQLPGRVGRQIRDRWVNRLNPNITHRPFTREDDILLWEGRTQLGKRWVDLSTTLFQSTKSENQIKNRWNSVSFKKFVTNEFGPTAYADQATARRRSSTNSNSSNAAIVETKASSNDRTLSSGESTVIVPMPLQRASPAQAVPLHVVPKVLLVDPSTITGSRTTTATNTYATVAGAEVEDEAGTVEAAAAAAAAMNAMHHTTETMHTLVVENNNTTEEDGVPSPYRHV